MIVGVATPSPLRRRLERVIAAEEGVRVVDLDAARHVDLAATHGSLPDHVEAARTVALPLDPIVHLADLLAAECARLAGSESTETVAATRAGSPLDHGIAVTFPPPLGARWGEPEGDRIVCPAEGDLAGIATTATGIRGRVRLGVVDLHDFLAAIGLAAPVLATIRDVDELEAARTAGLAVAEFVAI
ncbi:MAG: hypothetical protein AB1Z57_04195 [Acidimicrobiia bacterium]